MTVGGNVEHRACPAFQIRSELVNQALHALPMSRSKMAGGPCQQLRYFTGNQTGRNHLRRSADNHGLAPDGPLKSTWPNHITANSYCLHLPSIRCPSLSVPVVHFHPPAPGLGVHQACPGRALDSSSWPWWLVQKWAWDQPVPMRVSSGTFAGTCECNTECTFPLRAQGRQWVLHAFDSIAQPHVEKACPEYEIDTEESRGMRWRRNGVKEWEQEN